MVTTDIAGDHELAGVAGNRNSADFNENRTDIGQRDGNTTLSP